MLHTSVSIGDKIEVRQLNSKGIPIKNIEPYSSQLLDFFCNQSETIISIGMPLRGGQTFMLKPGIHYNLLFFTDKGLYQCNCKMLRSYKEKNTLIAAVLVTTELEKVQRRQYYRLEILHEIEFCFISQEEINIIDKIIEDKDKDNLKEESDSSEKADVINTLIQWSKDWKKAHVVDISGGGVRFNSDFLLEPQDQILIRIDFTLKDEEKNLLIGANVIQSSRIESHFKKYVTRAQFTRIKESDRDDLIKYIFEKERKMRKNNRELER